MEKRVWTKPLAVVEKFTMNEYIAACGDSGTVYKFTCDAGNGWDGYVYQETNGKPGLQTGWGGDEYLGSYGACKVQHDAESDSGFYEGYYLPFFSDETIDVIIWKGENNDNIHCTTKLNKKDWETAKS